MCTLSTAWLKSYEHNKPESVGNTRRVLVSELSTKPVEYRRRRAVASESSARQCPGMEECAPKQVARNGESWLPIPEGEAEASFDLLVQRAAGKFKPHFELLHSRVDVETDGDGKTTTEATVKLRIGDDLRHEVAEGDGPVNALDAALRKALNGHFPNLRGVQLVDYKVRVINSDAGTAAAVRVVIESQDEDGKTWGTVGVNENVIKASWDALVDSIEYKLCKDNS